MSTRSCWDVIFHPFSAVIKVQKQFTNDVLENVKKQREVIVKHHREMANRRIELHLDELEEKYLCCVCGTKGQDRDFEPPLLLLNKIGETSPDIELPNEQVNRHRDGVLVSPAANPDQEMIATSPTAQFRSEDGDDPVTPYFLRNVPKEELQSAYEQISAERVDPRDIRRLIEAAKHSIVSAKKLKRLEDRHKRHGSYHKDKGLMRIHETDIESFSQFFQKPVRGFLCEACYNCARHRLESLTNVIQVVVAKAKVPFTRHARCAAQGKVILSDDDIVVLRKIAKCAVCTRRRPTYFLRQTVLFLCEYCCAIDKFYRENAVCLNDEPMEPDTASMLQALAKFGRGDFEDWKQAARVVSEVQRQNYIQPCTLFSREYNLFDIQPLQLDTPGHDTEYPTVLEAVPFLVNQLDERSVARSTERSLFSNKEVVDGIDLFLRWKIERPDEEQ